jgi:hypothetical protein
MLNAQEKMLLSTLEDIQYSLENKSIHLRLKVVRYLYGFNSVLAIHYAYQGA